MNRKDTTTTITTTTVYLGFLLEKMFYIEWFSLLEIKKN